MVLWKMITSSQDFIIFRIIYIWQCQLKECWTVPYLRCSCSAVIMCIKLISIFSCNAVNIFPFSNYLRLEDSKHLHKCIWLISKLFSGFTMSISVWVSVPNTLFYYRLKEMHNNSVSATTPTSLIGFLSHFQLFIGTIDSSNRIYISWRNCFFQDINLIHQYVLILSHRGDYRF